jgi:hypothetical protein
VDDTVPRRTELSYWSISVLPATSKSFRPRLLTLSVHSLETLIVEAPSWDPERTMIRMNVDLPTMLDRWDTLDRLMDDAVGLVARETSYAVRPNVLALQVEGGRNLMRLLSLDGVVDAARRLNLDLMRKGPAFHWKTHCFDLVDAFLEPVDDDRDGADLDANALFDHFTEPAEPRIAYGKISKVLHLKRPHLYPILDSQLRAAYRRPAKAAAQRYQQHRPRVRWSYWAAIRDDAINPANVEALRTVRTELRAHRQDLVRRAAELSDVRLLDILTWRPPS